MLAQYREIKSRHPDKILFFRLGDFYEMFFEDAEIASRELGITLTSREAGKGQRRMPMAGIPYHAASGYLATLLDKGYRVAICEQVEDPRKARGLVRREVVRVVTPGTVVDPRSLQEKNHNYAVMITESDQPAAYGLAVLEFSTGEFWAAEFRGDRPREALLDEIARLEPAEILVEDGAGLAAALGTAYPGRVGEAHPPPGGPEAAAKLLQEHFRCASLEALGCQGRPLATAAAGVLLAYVQETSASRAVQITRLAMRSHLDHLLVDATTCRHLELVRSSREGGRRGSLIRVLDRTATPAGGRLLRAWLLRPCSSLEEIALRHDAVAELVDRPLLRGRLRECLRRMPDYERLAGRAAVGEANARDLLALGTGLGLFPELGGLLAEAKASRLVDLGRSLPDLAQLSRSIRATLVDSPPAAVKEGGLIREGHDPEVDRLRAIAGGGKEWVAALEVRERERTGIRSLKVGFNRVFGYYLEVTRANLEHVPPDFERRQTLAGAERFVTMELKEREAMILGAEAHLADREYELFAALRERTAAECSAIQAGAAAAAEADVLACLGEVAALNGYVRPQMVDSPVVEIREGRHPVVEQILPGGFVPNDATLDGRGERLVILTGPNMAGKSTYCRMVALICLMAQMGGFVPAASARLGPVGRIFTRIGASDDLIGGASTFMVEMQEVANILSHATPDSLVILDEIGRGTSTFDGLSIAWSVAEELARMGPLTLFATHYHELTELEGSVDGVVNHTVAVREAGDDVVFLYRVVRGSSDRSYGLHVARLAGIAGAVRERARAILESLEAGCALSAERPAMAPRSAPKQYQLFAPPPSPTLEELRELNVLALTPLEAINTLYRLQEQVRRER